MRNATTPSEAPLPAAPDDASTPQIRAAGLLYAEFLDAVHDAQAHVSTPADPQDSAPVGDVLVSLLQAHPGQRDRVASLLAACTGCADESVSWQACLLLHELASLFATGQVYALTESGAIDA